MALPLAAQSVVHSGYLLCIVGDCASFYCRLLWVCFTALLCCTSLRFSVFCFVFSVCYPAHSSSLQCDLLHPMYLPHAAYGVCSGECLSRNKPFHCRASHRTTLPSLFPLLCLVSAFILLLIIDVYCYQYQTKYVRFLMCYPYGNCSMLG